MPAEPDLEDLLAEALQRFDEGGEPAIDAFVAAHPDQASALARGIRRCREMGLLGSEAVRIGSDPAHAQPAQSAHPERLGDYRLVRRLGGGGMGVVYEAVQEPLGRRVALKVIRPELLFFEGARERFRREIDAIARLEHPAIVSVFAAGECEGVPFFAMEVIEGLTLDQVIARLAGRDAGDLRGADLAALLGDATARDELFTGSWWESAARIGLHLAQGLRHAHLRGIVHRDVKPSNGIVTPHGRVVVLDFGVAQVREAREMTRSGHAPGSPAFMSPEQWAGQATDERTDVFSLAATLWALVTLERPFRDAEQARLADQLPPLRARCRTAPRELDLVLRTAMDPERDRRYGDLAAFAADLQAVLDRRTIAARPLGRGLRLVRWTQRHRAATAALLATGFAALAFGAALLVQQHRAGVELAAEQQRTRDSLDASLEALQSILVRLGNTSLRGVPRAEPIAHGALVDAAAIFRSLVASHPVDGKVRVNAARSLNALALSFAARGDLAHAEATANEALGLLGDGDDLPPAWRDVRAHLHGSLAALALDRRRADAARAAIAAAEADYLAAAAAPPLRAESLRARAELCTQRSLLLDEGHEPDAVERELKAAIDLQRQCDALGAPDPKDPSLLVLHLTNYGRFLQRQRRDEARGVLESALQLARELPEAGTWPPPAVYVADAEEELGNLLANARDPGAEALLTSSLAARQRAVDQYPSHVEFLIRLGGALHNHARSAIDDPERTAAALAELERARQCQRDALRIAPGHAMALDFLGKHLEMIGVVQKRLRDAAGLAATAQELTDLPPHQPHQPRLAQRAAEFWLESWRLGGSSDATLLDRAMAALTKAGELGMKAKVLQASGWNPLRDRAEFAALERSLGEREPAK